VGNSTINLLFLLVTSASNVVELELIVVFGRSNNTNPVTERVLLKELLGQVLKVPL